MDTALILADDGQSPQIFEDWLAGQLSDQTKRAYASDIKQFAAWLSETWGISDMRLTDRQHVTGWREYLKAQGRGNGTIARKLAALAAFFSEAVAADIIMRNPAEASRVKRYRVSDESPRAPLENREIRILLQQPNRSTLLGMRDYAILSILVFLGLRRAEVVSLTIGSIGHERSHITVRVQGKGQKVRTLPVPARVHEAIKSYLHKAGRDNDPPSAPLFEPTVNNKTKKLEKPIDDDTIWRLVKKYGKMAEIDPTRIMTHILRHTAITNAIENGASPTRVQYMAGHSDIKTTMHYVGRQDNLDDSAVNRVDYSE